MNKQIQLRLSRILYSKKIWLWPLLPFSCLYRLWMQLRRKLYQVNVFKVHRLPVPVIVVGNLTAGGTGKSPIVVYLAKLLKEKGYQPGIISRGYGRKGSGIKAVSMETTPEEVGDEAQMIYHKTGCPVMVGNHKFSVGKALLQQFKVDIIISDDGLQHESLGRDIELIVIDGQRGLGNGWCLPVGPLREPVSRLKEADFVLVNGQVSEEISHDFCFELKAEQAICQHETRNLEEFKYQTVHAIAGIGHPKRFFQTLTKASIEVIEHPFPDHYAYQPSDFSFSDEHPVMLTEKDAVKCPFMNQPGYWAVPVQVEMPDRFIALFTQKLEEVLRGQETTRYSRLPNL